MSPLEAARALVRQKRGDQAGGVNSFNSFISSPGDSSKEPENAVEATKETKERGLGRTKTLARGYEKNERNEISLSDDLDERAAIIEYGAGVPRAWAEGFAALCAMSAPNGFSPERWQRIIDATGTFLDRWAAEAVAAGWSDLDIFGCDPDRPDARFDCMGLVLLLDRREIVSIDEHGADLIACPDRARQRYRRRPLPGDTVSLWDLVSAGRGRDAS
jgi:hypothetical protein